MARINSNPLGGLSQSEVDARVAAGITGKADSSALSGLVSSSDLSTALADKVSSTDLTTALSSKADSSALSGLASTSDVMGALATTAGIEAHIDPVAITGDGTEKSTSIVFANSWTPADGHKYELRGIIRANAHGGSRNKIAHVRIDGFVVSFTTGGGFVCEDVGTAAIEGGVDADPFFPANFYARAGAEYVPSEVPAFSPDGANIKVVHTLLNTMQIDLEFDGTIVDHGTSGAA